VHQETLQMVAVTLVAMATLTMAGRAAPRVNGERRCG
jgi:hypothetical protein